MGRGMSRRRTKRPFSSGSTASGSLSTVMGRPGAVQPAQVPWRQIFAKVRGKVGLSAARLVVVDVALNGRFRTSREGVNLVGHLAVGVQGEHHVRFALGGAA